MTYYRVRPTRMWRTLEYTFCPGVAYSRVRPTRVWRTLEYATTKQECTLESKICLESVTAPIPALKERNADLALILNVFLVMAIYHSNRFYGILWGLSDNILTHFHHISQKQS